MFERFSDRARRVLVLAQEESRLLNHSFIGTEHILLGLIHEGDGVAAKSLEAFGISLASVREQIDRRIGPTGIPHRGSPPFSPRAKKTLELALREALQLGHNHIGTEHLLLGLVRDGEGAAAEVLNGLGVDLPRLRQHVLDVVASGGSKPMGVPREGAFFREPDWTFHPSRVVAGPQQPLISEGVEFRVVGALLFPEGVRTIWRLSGVPTAITDAMSEGGVLARRSRGAGAYGMVGITDDLESTYAPAGSIVEMQERGECAGSAFFTPAIPDAASLLRVLWQGEVLDVDLGATT